MVYSGGLFSGEGVSFVEAFSNSDASVGLMYGSFFAFLITVIFYAYRKVLSFGDSMKCVPEGFKAMATLHSAYIPTERLQGLHRTECHRIPVNSFF